MSKDNKIKDYIKLAQPSLFHFIFQLITAILAYVTVTIAALFAAKVIVALSVGDFKGAIMWLAIELVLHLLRQVIWNANYIMQCKLYSRCYRTVQGKIYNKIISVSQNSMEKFSKERLINLVGGNTETVSIFGDTIATELSKMAQLILTIVIVLSYNVLVAGLIVLLGVADFFILKYLNSRLAKGQKAIYESKDKLFEDITTVYENKSLISEFNAKDYYLAKYNKRVENYLGCYRKNVMTNNVKSQWVFAFYRTVIFFITCFLISLLSGQAISLEVYLVVTPYLLTCTELINGLINTSYTIGNLDVSTKRINTLLNMDDEDIASFGKIQDSTDTQNLSIVNASYKNEDTTSQFYGKITDADLSFRYNEFNLVKGAKRSGKRLLFYMLNRKIKPNNGIILIDGIDINGYNKKSFRKQIYSMTYKSQFLNATVGTNLELVCKNKTKIHKALKRVGLYDTIRALPYGLDTKVEDTHFEEFQFYLLSLARCILVDSSVIVIYEYPNALSDAEKVQLYNIFESFAGTKTIVLFTAKHDFDKLAKMTYVIENGKVVWSVK